MIEMYVKQIGVSTRDGYPVILLKEKNGTRVVPIWVGPAELKAISLALMEVVPSRPQTHDLMITALEAIGYKIVGLDIFKLSEETFFATLHLIGRRNKELVLDCRPSDGIALALRHHAPITVAPSVVDQAGYSDDNELNAAGKETSDESKDEFKEFLQSVKPADFAKYLTSKSKRKSDRSQKKPPAEFEPPHSFDPSERADDCE